MRTLFGFLLFVALGAAIHAQQPTAPSSPTSAQDGPPAHVFISDGGATQVLQSIHIPPLQRAPFSATVHTEWIRPLPGGGTFTLVNQRQVARDSLGRIYQERWYLVPKDGKTQSQMYLVQIFDPFAHTFVSCYLLRTPHVCVREPYPETATTTYIPPSTQNSPLPNGNGFRTHEDLGIQDIDGFETVGSRDTMTVNQGVIGNDKPFNVSREFWFASRLGINLRSEISDPTFGKEVFSVTEVNPLDPDPKLFEIPGGFEIVDQMKPAAQTD